MKTRKTRLCLVSLAAFTLVACHVEILGDLRVDWTIEGSDAASLCGTYGIGSWRVTAERGGTIHETDLLPCAEPWFFDFVAIEEGFYDVTVEAYDTDGAFIAAESKSNVELIGTRSVHLDFAPSDLGVLSTLDVYWNINGTVDGQPKGQSWDTCAEVGAASVEVEIDGTSYIVDCAAGGNMAASFDELTAPPETVRTRLLDSSEQPLTTWTPTEPGPSPVDGPANTWEYVGEFMYFAFTTDFDGTYWFNVAYQEAIGGEDFVSCSDAFPQISYSTALMHLQDENGNKGDVVDGVQVCGGPTGDVCYPANGTSTGPCYPMTVAQNIPDVLWGSYFLRLQGTSDDLTICWEETFDILVGAGTDNPEAELNVTRVDEAGSCAP